MTSVFSRPLTPENQRMPGRNCYERMGTRTVRTKKAKMIGEDSEQARLLAEQTASQTASLVLAIVAGDRQAERDFAVSYLPKVRTMLVARSRNRDLADDLAQEVMIEAICALRRGQLREPSKLTPFVLAIARNVLNSHYRGAARQPESPRPTPWWTTNASPWPSAPSPPSIRLTDLFSI